MIANHKANHMQAQLSQIIYFVVSLTSLQPLFPLCCSSYTPGIHCPSEKSFGLLPPLRLCFPRSVTGRSFLVTTQNSLRIFLARRVPITLKPF